MARKVIERKEFGSSVQLDELLGGLPLGLGYKDVEIEGEVFWEWGDSYGRIVASWSREETENERLIRERAERLKQEAVAKKQEEKDQTEYARLCRKYGTYV